LTTKPRKRTSAPTPNKKQGRPGDVARLVAVGALAEGLSVQEAADRAGITRQTLWEWRTKDPDFQRLEQEALEEVARTVVAMGVFRAQVSLKELAPLAVGRLRELLAKGLQEDEEPADDQIILRAAEAVLKRLPEFASRAALEVNVTGELTARLGELDAAGDTASD
jgi:transcriptional regulator with XRE-family HTH domain